MHKLLDQKNLKSVAMATVVAVYPQKTNQLYVDPLGVNISLKLVKI